MHTLPSRRLLFCLVGLLVAAPAAALPPGFALEHIHGPISFTTTLRFAPDGRLFFTELSGRVAYYPSLSFPTPVIWTTVPVYASGERGLLGLAFHPDFPDSPYIYLDFSNPSPAVDRLVRYVDWLGQAADSTILFDVPADVNVHHGGRVAFGPDGMIYVTHGDEGDMVSAQDPSLLAGKIFRLGRGGKPAPENPWGPSNPAAVLGIRNVFGLCFDPLDGTGYFTENGPECDDEINLLALGANYGWGPSEFCGGQPAGTFQPLTLFNPTIAPTGCCVYRGGVYPARFDGNLFFGTYNDHGVYRVRFVPGHPDRIDSVDVFATFDDPVIDLTVGPDGQLWVATTSDIFRFTYNQSVAVGDPDPRAQVSLSLAPNPSRGVVAIEAERAPAGARIDLLDLQGRHLRSWDVTGSRRVPWDGRIDGGSVAPVGVYLVRLSAPGFATTRRLVRLGS